jgi:uncharacterized protein
VKKTRPIFGAFVLYPGWFNEENTDNPYAEAVEAVGIGGFPLLPGRPNIWLRDFLESRFGNATVAYRVPEPDQYLAEDSARIATTGLYLGRYEDLTLAASLGSGRDKQYVERFQQGTAGWYHMPLATTDKKALERNVMREIRYCAIGAYDSESKERVITHLYEVKSVRLVKRCNMTVVQAGKVDPDTNADCWLFELGYARPLAEQIKIPTRTFKFQLTSSAAVLAAESWEALPKRYTLLA